MCLEKPGMDLPSRKWMVVCEDWSGAAVLTLLAGSFLWLLFLWLALDIFWVFLKLPPEVHTKKKEFFFLLFLNLLRN